MAKTPFKRVFTVLGLLLAGGGVRADLTSDSQKSAEWFSGQMADLLAFQAASTFFLPANTVGFPGVEVGLAGGASAMKLDVDGYRRLSFDTLDKTQADLPDMIAAPVGVLHAKAGLPGGWDVGLQVGSANFDSEDGDARTDFENKVFGLEVRKRILSMPDLLVSLAWDTASGEITRTERYNGPVTGGTLDANTRWRSEWDLSAVTARAVVSKKLLIFTPFAGVGFTKLSGDAETTVETDVITTTAGLVDTSTRGAADADDTVGHIILGLEISPLPFFRLSLSGLAAKERWAASLGLRVQFP